MSTPPDPRWVPAARPVNPASDVNWRIRHSLWLLIPVLGCSCLGGVGLIYVGVRAGRPAWWIPGVAYLAAGTASFVPVSGGGAGTETTTAGALGTAATFAVWIAGIVHSVLINPGWLRWRAAHVPWYAESAAVPPPRTRVTEPPPAPGPVPVSLDVNVAEPEDIAALPGFDPGRAAAVVAIRQARGRFGTVQEFADAAGLAPHEFARIRHQLRCDPPGRVLDV